MKSKKPRLTAPVKQCKSALSKYSSVSDFGDFGTFRSTKDYKKGLLGPSEIWLRRMSLRTLGTNVNVIRFDSPAEL